MGVFEGSGGLGCGWLVACGPIASSSCVMSCLFLSRLASGLSVMGGVGHAAGLAACGGETGWGCLGVTVVVIDSQFTIMS